MLRPIATTALLMAMTACGTTGSGQSTSSTATSGSTAADSRIAALEAELASRNSRISDLEGELSGAADSGASSIVAANPDDLFPPNARAGECYARVLIPEQYTSKEERVLVKEASESVSVVPATYETVTERVLMKEASTRLEVIPATYETVTERVMVRPAGEKIVKVPATYRTVTERVLDKPAYTVWKRGAANTFGNGTNVVSQSVNGTGEVMCLVEVPASYKTISKQVVDTPAGTRTVESPAEFKTIERRVLKNPASTREVTIPAEYGTVAVTKLVRPASESRTPVPAQYKTVTKTTKVSDASLAWQSVLCDVNSSPENIRALQSALKEKGYTVAVDGQLGPGTITAVNRYASSLGIPQGANYVPLDVIKKLGLNF